MARTYEQLQRQIEALQAEADRVCQEEVAGVIAKMRQAIDYYGITAAELGFSAGAKAAAPRAAKGPGRKARVLKAAAKTKQPAEVAYRDANGNTWVGRGKRPQWLRDALAGGRSLDEFRVAKA